MRSALLCAVALTAACAGARPPPVGLTASFDPAEAQRLLQPGPNRIVGAAYVQDRDVHCSAATIIPVTSYALERVRILYGSDSWGFRQFEQGERGVFEATDPAYVKARRNTRCDAGGMFEFDQLADGDYFLIAVVGGRAGVNIMQRIQIAGGATRKVLLGFEEPLVVETSFREAPAEIARNAVKQALVGRSWTVDGQGSDYVDATLTRSDDQLSVKVKVRYWQDRASIEYVSSVQTFTYSGDAAPGQRLTGFKRVSRHKITSWINNLKKDIPVFVERERARQG